MKRNQAQHIKITLGCSIRKKADSVNTKVSPCETDAKRTNQLIA